jgi:hypothetical protein
MTLHTRLLSTDDEQNAFAGRADLITAGRPEVKRGRVLDAGG